MEQRDSSTSPHAAMIREFQGLRKDMVDVLGSLKSFALSKKRPASCLQAVELEWRTPPVRVFRYGRTRIPPFSVGTAYKDEAALLQVSLYDARTSQPFLGVLKGTTTVKLVDGVATFDGVEFHLSAKSTLKRMLLLCFVVHAAPDSVSTLRIEPLRSKAVLVHNRPREVDVSSFMLQTGDDDNRLSTPRTLTVAGVSQADRLHMGASGDQILEELSAALCPPGDEVSEESSLTTDRLELFEALAHLTPDEIQVLMLEKAPPNAPDPSSTGPPPKRPAGPLSPGGRPVWKTIPMAAGTGDARVLSWVGVQAWMASCFSVLVDSLIASLWVAVAVILRSVRRIAGK